jgi:Ca2+-binding RTX toxin-like protein
MLAAIGLAVPLIATASSSWPSRADVQPTCDGKVATIVVAPVISSPGWGVTEPVLGTPGDDVIVGSEEQDTIDGGPGNDVICGLAGADVLTGGPGNDRLFGGLDNYYVPDEDGYFGDVVVPGPGDDYIDLGADPDSRYKCPCDSQTWDRVSFAGAPGPVSVDLEAGTASGEGTDLIVVPTPHLSAGIIGTPYDDVLLGSAAKDLIHAGGGNDVVEGRAGSDSISLDETSPVASDDNDRVDAGSGYDDVFGRTGTDEIVGGDGNDWLGGGPQATVRGGAGKDRLRGTSGTALLGGAGSDNLQLKLTSKMVGKVDGGGGLFDALWLRLPRSLFPSGLHLKVDIPRQRFAIDRRQVLELRGLERFIFHAPPGRLAFLGGRRDEYVHPDRESRIRAFGRGGSDVLRGGAYGDLLDGGPGEDVLQARNGLDRCLNGEEFGSCEVRR